VEEELPPRSRRSRRSRSTSPRTSRTKDTEAEGVARRDAAARRRPREPDTDVVTNEVETKRRRLDSLREQGRPSPSSISQHPSEKNESLRGLPNAESRAYCKLGIPRTLFINLLDLLLHLQAKDDSHCRHKIACTRNQLLPRSRITSSAVSRTK
jgi:hypothetical protein